MTDNAIARERCVVRNTASKKGRTRTVAPDKTATRHLHYGRIILDAGDDPIAFETGGMETGFICMNGAGTISVDGTDYSLTKYDSLYTPRGSSVRVTPGANGCDITEIAAPVERSHPVQFVSFAQIKKDPGLHFQTGAAGARRDLHMLFGKNVQAGRIMAGVTFSEPGNWTSWPPHEHSAIAEEAYLYVDMPAPAFGVQFVYSDAMEPELATFVREGDVVIMPSGYHPNVAAPGMSINFIWMMAANREDEDRLFGVVNVQPDFAAMGSGLEKGRSEKKRR